MMRKFFFIVVGAAYILGFSGTVEPTSAGPCNPAIQTC